MKAASIVPAAQGEVDVSKDKNGNIKLKIKVDHLAKPENLSPPQTVYVVWIQAPGGNPENQGQLKVDDKLKANFETAAPPKTFDLFITAEQDGLAHAPSGPEVLRATIQP
jgi:hypothetical protein